MNLVHVLVLTWKVVHRRNKNQNTILFLTSVCLRLVFFLTSLIPPLLRSLRKIKTSVAWNTRLKFNFIKTLFNGSKSYGFERCGEWRWVNDDINVSWVNKSCCKLNQLLYPFMSSSSRHSLFRFTLPVSFFHFLKRSDGQKQIVKSQMFTSEWRHWKVRRLPLSLQHVLAKPDCARNGWKNGGITVKKTDPRSEHPSSPSSMSEGGPVRGGQERVDTFRARMEPVGTGSDVTLTSCQKLVIIIKHHTVLRVVQALRAYIFMYIHVFVILILLYDKSLIKTLGSFAWFILCNFDRIKTGFLKDA